MISLGPGFWLTALGLAIGVLNGGQPRLLWVDIDFRFADGLEIYLEPVFIIYGDVFYAPCGQKEVFGAFHNVIYWSKWAADYLYWRVYTAHQGKYYSRDEFEYLILQHEFNHVRQYRAVGFLFPIAQRALPWEGVSGTYSLDTLKELNQSMWHPPIGWQNLGWTLRISLGI